SHPRATQCCSAFRNRPAYESPDRCCAPWEFDNRCNRRGQRRTCGSEAYLPLTASGVVIVHIPTDRKVRRTRETDRAVHLLHPKGRRAVLKQPEFASDRLADHSRRNPRRDGVEQFGATPGAVGSFRARCFAIPGTGAARLARPVNEVAVLI